MSVGHGFGRLGVSMVVAGAMLLGACGDSKSYSQAVCVLVDVSGTYADEKPNVVEIVKKGILPTLLPGDALIVMRIDAESYEAANVEASIVLDERPSRSHAQKLEFAQQLDAFAAGGTRARYTDIQGALMLASEYLKETGAGTQTIVTFSDMQEDLPNGVRRKLATSEFENIRVCAVNVKRLKADNADPMVYRERLAKWEERVRGSGAQDWRVVVDGAKLSEYLDERL